MVPPRPCPGPRVCPRRRATGRSRLRLRCGVPRASLQPSGPGCPSGLHRAGGRRGRTPRRVHGRPPHGWSAHGARPPRPARASSPQTACVPMRRPSSPGPTTLCTLSSGSKQASRPCGASPGRRRSMPGAGPLLSDTTALQGVAIACGWSMLGRSRPRTSTGGSMAWPPGRGARTRAHTSAGSPTCGCASARSFPAGGGPRPVEDGTGDVADAAKAGRHLCAP